MFANKFGRYENIECGLVRLIEPPPSSHSYLITDGPKCCPIPLQSVNVLASVAHGMAQMELTQIYVNKEAEPIEAFYYFPLDSSVTIIHFQAELEGKTIQGVVEARREDEEPEKASEAALFVECNKPDVFKVRVGFLTPGSPVKIVIGWVSQVKNEVGSNAIRFVIPNTIAPGYSSSDPPPNLRNSGKARTEAEENDVGNVDENETENVELTTQLPSADLSLTVNVALQGKIQSIVSPTHRIRVEPTAQPVQSNPNWTHSTVKLGGVCEFCRTAGSRVGLCTHGLGLVGERNTTDVMNTDFELLIQLEDVHEPKLYSQRSENSVALMTYIIPKFEADEQKCEFIFVLDRYGSMGPDCVELAKKALTLFLHSLPVDCYFNVVFFMDNWKFLFPDMSLRYEDKALKIALDFANDVKTDLGGTDIYVPLEKIFSQEYIPNYFRQIFVVTDGQVHSNERVIGICHENASKSRVFAVCVGDSGENPCRSYDLVEGITKVSGGTAIFVNENERIDTKVLRLLKQAIRPALTNVRHNWLFETTGPTPATAEVQAPIPTKSKKKAVPLTSVTSRKRKASKMSDDANCSPAVETIWPVFDGTQLVAFGLFAPDAVPTGVEVLADSVDGQIAIKLKLSQAIEFGGNEMLLKLAAVKKVRELEMKESIIIAKAKYRPSGWGYCHRRRGRGPRLTMRPKQSRAYLEPTPESQIVPIGCQHGIMSKYTSFVAVTAKRKRKVKDDNNWIMLCRYNYRWFPTGWCNGKWFGIAWPRGVRSASWLPSLWSSVPPSDDEDEDDEDEDDDDDDESNDEDTSKDLGEIDRQQNTVHKIVPQTPEDFLHALVATQLANGSFVLNEDFAIAVDMPLVVLKEECGKDGCHGCDSAGWATALALTYLTDRLNELKDAWELFEAKGQKWLSKNFDQQVLDGLFTAAQNLLKKEMNESRNDSLFYGSDPTA